MTKILVGFVVVIAALGLGALAWLSLWPASGDRFAACRESGMVVSGDGLGGPFTLVSHTGRTMTEAEAIDRPSLVYFGYAFCPDVCPLDVSRNAEVVDLLAEDGLSLKPIFITVDPERDTPDALEEFVGYMHPDMLGLTGTQEQVSGAERAYRVYAAKVGEGENYLMDHTTYSYLMDPQEGFLAVFRRDLAPEDMASQVACYLERL